MAPKIQLLVLTADKTILKNPPQKTYPTKRQKRKNCNIPCVDFPCAPHLKHCIQSQIESDEWPAGEAGAAYKKVGEQGESRSNRQDHLKMRLDMRVAFSADRDFLKKGDVFSDDQIDAYIDVMMAYHNEVNMAPHPMEFKLYYSV